MLTVLQPYSASMMLPGIVNKDKTIWLTGLIVKRKETG